MHLGKLLLMSAAIVGFSYPARTQVLTPDTTIDKDAFSPGILGYLDPKTGAFRPVQQGSDLAPAVTTLTGEIEYKITVTIKSTIAATTPIVCGGSANVVNLSGLNHSESASVAASRTGSTATCTVLIPYAWALASTSGDSVILGYSVSAGAARISIHSLPAIKVPANNTTTTETVAVTI